MKNQIYIARDLPNEALSESPRQVLSDRKNYQLEEHRVSTWQTRWRTTNKSPRRYQFLQPNRQAHELEIPTRPK